MKCVAFWPHALDESGGSLHVDRLWNAAAIVFLPKCIRVLLTRKTRSDAEVLPTG